MSTVVCYIWITIVVSIAALYSGRRIPANYVAKHIALPLGKTEYTSYNASFIDQMQISGAHISDVLPYLIEFSYSLYTFIYLNGLVYFNVFSTWVLSTQRSISFTSFLYFQKLTGF